MEKEQVNDQEEAKTPQKEGSDSAANQQVTAQQVSPNDKDTINISTSLQDIYKTLNSIDPEKRTKEIEEAKKTVELLQKEVDDVESQMLDKYLTKDNKELLKNVIIKEHLTHNFKYEEPKRVKNEAKISKREFIIYGAILLLTIALIVVAAILASKH